MPSFGDYAGQVLSTGRSLRLPLVSRRSERLLVDPERPLGTAVKQLRALGPEHRWPASLSAPVGATANANGPVTMPLWNGNANRSEMTFGD